ncbi:MAG: ABC transporter substrate-binding protein [Microthrixaceae bacterium]|nr:ABC transporter substrate-binding protein [Microthrixaceae bacterium]
MVLGTLPDAGDATRFPYVVRPEVPASGQAPALAAFVQRSGFTRPAILAVNNGLGQGMVPPLEAEFAALGLDVAGVEFHEAGLVDLSPQIRALVDADPDVLVLITIGADAVTALRARGDIAPDLPVVGLGVIADQATVDAVGEENMDNVFAGPTYRAITRPEGADDLSTPEATAFRDALSDFIGQDPLTINIQQPAAAYDDLMMLAAAIESVGQVDADGIRTYLESNGHQGIRGTYRFSHENHDGVDWRDTVFVLASSLEHGTLQLAPGE